MNISTADDDDYDDDSTKYIVSFIIDDPYESSEYASADSEVFKFLENEITATVSGKMKDNHE